MKKRAIKKGTSKGSAAGLFIRNASFLKFLISGATDIDKFLETKTNRPA